MSSESLDGLVAAVEAASAKRECEKALSPSTDDMRISILAAIHYSHFAARDRPTTRAPCMRRRARPRSQRAHAAARPAGCPLVRVLQFPASRPGLFAVANDPLGQLCLGARQDPATGLLVAVKVHRGTHPLRTHTGSHLINIHS